jgi:CheY-like chemotaxis protein
MLLGLINDILDFSKIDAGRMRLEEIEFALDDVLDNVTSVLLHRAQEKGLELQYVVDPDVPSSLKGDPLRLGQILINLIGNAIKFTVTGSITVLVRRLPGDDCVAHLEFDVQDTGIGMSIAQQQSLFNAFSQADTSITRKFGGTGLGLTISKQLAQLMKGDIWVRSQPNVGSTFTFSAKLALGRQNTPAPHLARRRALVVDDSSLACSILVALLEGQGYTALSAQSGERALAILGDSRSAPFEFVTIDLNMPGMSGLELADAIRNQITPSPRLVMVTASDTAKLAGETRLNFFDAVLNKPVTAAQISKLINQGDAPAASAPGKPAPLAGVRVLLVEDMPTNQLIASEILESFGITVDLAENGVQALKKLLDEGNSYDMVLMDIQMPEMDGLAATRHLRASGKLDRLPIIAMTAHAMDSERQRCLDVGMNDFVTKPIDPEGLRDILIRWRPTQATPAQARKMESAPMSSADGLPDLPGIDTADGLRRMMNKPALYEKVLRDFHARFMAEPGAIHDAIQAGDFATAERRAHSTKGLAGTIGALGLQNASKELELALRQGEPLPEDVFQRFENELNAVIASIARGFRIE